MNADERLIVALDFHEKEKFIYLLDGLKDIVKWIKIGAVPFTAFGPEALRWAKDRGYNIFLDMKYHDIPNTVSNAVRVAIKEDVNMLTVHALGGKRMLESVQDVVKSSNSNIMVLGVTVLTSMDDDEIKLVGINKNVKEEIALLANLVFDSGLSGIVASVWESAYIKQMMDKKGKKKRFVIVTPGIRLEEDNAQDQKRVATPCRAIKEGADYIVVGRSITLADNPVNMARKYLEILEMCNG